MSVSPEGEEVAARVALENPGAGLAFLVRLRLLKGKDGPEILPVFWEDNYLCLLPGEKREVLVRVRQRDLGGFQPVLAVDGFNVTP
jgi:exo-1,4-beta-D-glucosaminidase